jgi:restriction endonuclease S subunit
MTMDNWRNRTPAEKAKFLSQQLEDIRRARALIERFEQLTQKWLKRVQTIGKDVQPNGLEA